MAGRRRARRDGRPRQTVARAARRRAALAVRMAAASTPAQRLTAAFVYARGALLVADLDPVRAQAVAEYAVGVLVGIGDDLLTPAPIKAKAKEKAR